MNDTEWHCSLDDHLRRAQKLDSIGTLAGGVAHDFNNILTVIISACALLEKSAAGNPEQIKLVNEISTYSQRAVTLTQSLLTFSRRQAINKESQNLGAVVKVMQDFLARILGNDILLTIYLPEEPLMVSIDRGQIELVLLNLVTNARDAMPHGGILNITVSLVEINQCMLAPEGCVPGEYALITVSDSGEGIDPATQQRIFDPFFTTRAIVSGTGLGLSIAYGIIRQHDGVIHVSSDPGQGTTFKIYLPLNDQFSCTQT